MKHAALVPLVSLLMSLSLARPAAAQTQAVRDEAARIVLDIQKGTRLQRTMAAIALRHFAARQSSFRLLGSTEPRWWQAAIAPAAPRLVQMLGDDSGLEWVDGNGMPEGATTPHKEAARALQSLERPAVEALLARLDDPRLGPRAAAVLAQIAPAGPGANDPAAWSGWWAQHQGELLPREHGQLGGLLLKLLLVALGVAAVVFLQQRMSRRAEAARR